MYEQWSLQNSPKISNDINLLKILITTYRCDEFFINLPLIYNHLTLSH
jgi:hypothetical protein